jgi:hypothetical protein
MNRDVLRHFFQYAMAASRALLLVALGCVASQAAAQISVTPSFAFGGPVANTANTTVRLTFNHNVLMTSVNGITSSAPVSLTNATFVSPTPTTNTCPASVVGVSATQISLSPLATPVLSELNTSCVIIWDVTINGPVNGNATISVAANSLSATVSSIFGPPTNFVFPTATATASTSIGSAPATMTVSVAPSTIRPDESVIATYTLTSSQVNGDFISSGQIFMPAGVTINSTPPPSNTCGTFGIIGSVPDFFSFGMGTVPNTGCTITLSLSASAAGVYALTVNPGDLNAGGPNTNTSTDNFSAQSPIITPQTPLGNTALAGSVFPLNYQIANPGGASNAVSGTINLVAGFTYGAPTTTCSGLAPVRTGNQITFSGSMTAGEICIVGVSTTATAAPGLYSFTITPGNLVIATSPNTNNSNAPVTVVAAVPPTVAVALAPPTVVVNSISSLTYTFSNSNGVPLAIASGQFTVPAGAFVSGTPSNTCGGTSSVLVSVFTEIRITGGSIPANGTCEIRATVSSASVGTYTFAVAPGNLSAVALNTNTASAVFTVIPALVPVVTSSATASGTVGLPFLYQITATNAPTGFSFGNGPPPPGLSGDASTGILAGTPTTAGTYVVQVSATNGAGFGPALNLTITIAGNVTLTPAGPLNFAAQIIGTTSAAQTITLANSVTNGLLISAIASTGDFAATSNCPIAPNVLPGSPPPLNQCTINVTFTPTSVQPSARTGNLTVTTTNAPPNNYTIALNGIATVAPVAAVTVAPLSLTFAATTVGSASAAQRLTVTNSGTANLTGITIAVTPGFERVAIPPSQVGPADCGALLAPSASCAIDVRFVPSAPGVVSGAVTIASPSVTPNTVTVPVSGNGAPAPVGIITLPGVLSFGDQIINSASAPQIVSIGNTGTASFVINSISLSGTDAASFVFAGNCASVTPGTSCNVTVAFAPASLGTKTATLNVVSTAQNAASTNAVALTGVGVPVPRPIASLSLTSISFGNTIFGGAAATQTILLQNTGVLPLAISGVIASPDYVQLNNCPASLAPQASCTVQVQFVPTGLGPRVGDLTVVSNALTSPDRVALRGVGCRWFSASNARLFTTLCGN